MDAVDGDKQELHLLEVRLVLHVKDRMQTVILPSFHLSAQL